MTGIRSLRPCKTADCTYVALDKMARDVLKIPVEEKEMPYGALNREIKEVACELLSESVPAIAFLCSRAYGVDDPKICPGIGTYTDCEFLPEEKASSLSILRAMGESGYMTHYVAGRLLRWVGAVHDWAGEVKKAAEK